MRPFNPRKPESKWSKEQSGNDNCWSPIGNFLVPWVNMEDGSGCLTIKEQGWLCQQLPSLGTQMAISGLIGRKCCHEPCIPPYWLSGSSSLPTLDSSPSSFGLSATLWKLLCCRTARSWAVIRTWMQEPTEWASPSVSARKWAETGKLFSSSTEPKWLHSLTRSCSTQNKHCGDKVSFKGRESHGIRQEFFSLFHTLSTCLFSSF